MAGAKTFVDQKLKQRRVLLFSRTFSPECEMVKEILDGYQLTNETYEIVEIESRQDCTQIENYFQILCLNDSRSVSKRNHMYILFLTYLTNLQELTNLTGLCPVVSTTGIINFMSLSNNH